MIYMVGLILPLLSFGLQVWPRLINRYFGIDTWRHLMYADYLRRHKKLPKTIKDRYLVNGPYGYPPVIIFFLSFFPKRFAKDYQFLFSPFFDFLNNYFIYLVTYSITLNIYISITAQIIAALVPIVVMEASNLNTRTISYIVFNISFWSLLKFSNSGGVFWLLLAFLFLVLLFFTHRFALQAYIFNLIALAIFEKNIFYVLFFLVTFLITYILGGELYKAILKEHLAILNYWRQRIEFRFAHQFRGNPKEKQFSDFVYRLYLLSFKNPYVYILGNNPWIGIYLVLLVLFKVSKLDIISLSVGWFAKFNIWIITSLLVAISILSIKKLRFLGEGHRYIEYSTLPLAILTSVFLWRSYIPYGNIVPLLFLVICLGLAAAIIFLQRKAIINDRARTVNSSLREIISYLNTKYGKKVRIAVFPFNLGDAMMYFLKGKVLTSDSAFGLLQIEDIFPIVTKPMEEIIKKYKLNFIFFDSRYVKLREMKLHKYKKAMELNDYILLKV